MPDESEGLTSETPSFNIGESISYNLGSKNYYTGQVKGHFTTRHPIDKDREVVTVVVDNAVAMQQRRHFGIGSKFWKATHLDGEQLVPQRLVFPLEHATKLYSPPLY